MFVHEPGLEQLWASVGDSADTWTIPDGSAVAEQMDRVVELVDEYGIEIVGEPLPLE